jgi:hypothetical protein
MLVVAADPESHQPGRLAHDGPWWNYLSPGPQADSRAPWCGRYSDAIRRQVDLPNGTVSRCSACHPLVKEAS